MRLDVIWLGMLVIHSDEIMVMVDVIVIVLVIKGQTISDFIDKSDKRKYHNPKPSTAIHAATLIQILAHC